MYLCRDILSRCKCLRKEEIVIENQISKDTIKAKPAYSIWKYADFTILLLPKLFF